MGVRRTAIDLLGHLAGGDEGVAQKVAAQLGCWDPDLRCTAMQALQQVSPPGGVAALEALSNLLMRELNENVRCAAVAAIELLRGGAASANERSNYIDGERAHTAMAAMESVPKSKSAPSQCRDAQVGGGPVAHSCGTLREFAEEGARGQSSREVGPSAWAAAAALRRGGGRRVDASTAAPCASTPPTPIARRADVSVPGACRVWQAGARASARALWKQRAGARMRRTGEQPGARTANRRSRGPAGGASARQCLGGLCHRTFVGAIESSGTLLAFRVRALRSHRTMYNPGSLGQASERDPHEFGPAAIDACAIACQYDMCLCAHQHAHLCASVFEGLVGPRVWASCWDSRTGVETRCTHAARKERERVSMMRTPQAVSTSPRFSCRGISTASLGIGMA